MPDRSEPMGKDMVKKRVPGSVLNRAPHIAVQYNPARS